MATQWVQAQSTPAIIPSGSTNPLEPIAGVELPQMLEMVADVASTALEGAGGAAGGVAAMALPLAASLVSGIPNLKLPPIKKFAAPPPVMGADGSVVKGFGFCLSCKLAAMKANPVNAVLGIKVLAGGEEQDFAFDGTMPLIWQRSYYSDQAGNGWLGQGWSLPFSNRLLIGYRCF